MPRLIASDFTNEFSAVIARFRSGYMGEGFIANPCPYMPSSLASKIIKLAGKRKSASWLVLFTVELAVELHAAGVRKVTVATEEHCLITKLLTERLGYKYMVLQDMKEKNMKFDAIVANPPYNGRAALHQQFFNKGYELLKDGGVMVFIQPATTFFNKKEKQKGPVYDMIDIIENNVCSVTITDPTVFENAGIQNDLSITVLKKVPSVSKVIESITYKNGTTYTDVPLEDISMTQLDPAVYRSIRNKYAAYVNTHGSLEDSVSREVGVLKACLGKIRGTRPTDNDFYTFIPLNGNRDDYGPSSNTDFGIAIPNNETADIVYDYLESYVARFGLAILKFSQNTKNKEFALVPLVSFDRKYSDAELYQLLGLTDSEIAVIKKVIVPLYDR
jgi:hypothetical protein